MTAALLAALALQATPETLADLERAYDQSCNSRVYGQFDDMCSAMEAQVRSYRAELKRRPRPSGPVAAPQAPPAPRVVTPSAQPAAEPTAAPKG